MQSNDYPPNSGQSNMNPDDPVELTDDDIADAIARASGNEPLDQENRAENAAPNPAVDKEQEAEIAGLKDQLMRMAAELENTRRRAEREKSDTARYAIAGFAHDLLAVADNFERALMAAGQDEAAQTPETMSTLIAGLRMTEKELISAFERHGLKRIHPKGEKFDPNIHQAVANQPSNDVPKGHIVDVAQTGFVIGERVLRAPMVTVSSGPAAPDTNAPGAHVDTQA